MSRIPTRRLVVILVVLLVVAGVATGVGLGTATPTPPRRVVHRAGTAGLPASQLRADWARIAAGPSTVVEVPRPEVGGATVTITPGRWAWTVPGISGMGGGGSITVGQHTEAETWPAGTTYPDGAPMTRTTWATGLWTPTPASGIPYPTPATSMANSLADPLVLRSTPTEWIVKVGVIRGWCTTHPWPTMAAFDGGPCPGNPPTILSGPVSPAGSGPGSSSPPGSAPSSGPSAAMRQAMSPTWTLVVKPLPSGGLAIWLASHSTGSPMLTASPTP